MYKSKAWRRVVAYQLWSSNRTHQHFFVRLHYNSRMGDRVTELSKELLALKDERKDLMETHEGVYNGMTRYVNEWVDACEEGDEPRYIMKLNMRLNLLFQSVKHWEEKIEDLDREIEETEGRLADL